jgi:2-oxoacid:acceptor oxidoreductase delta subunit (pyruvate/2-ketoisovalerate family)
LEKYAAFAAGKENIADKAKTKNNPQRIAVVANGIASLSYAHFMQLLGHRVTVFEQQPTLQSIATEAGLLALDLAHLEFEIQQLTTSGVEFVPVETFGKNDFLKVIEDYDAIYVTAEMYGSMQPPAASQMLNRLHTSRQIDQGIKTSEPYRLKGRVAVVGGGSEAVKAAFDVKDCGAQPIVFLSGTQKSLPIPAAEIERAVTAGIEFHFSTAVYGISYSDKGKPELHCQANPVGDPLKARLKGFDFQCDHVVSTLRNSRFSKSLPMLIRPDSQVIVVETAPTKGKPSRRMVNAIAAGKRMAFLCDITFRKAGFDELREHTIGKMDAVSTAAYRSRKLNNSTAGREIKKIVRYRELNLSDTRSSQRITPTRSDGIYSVRQAKRSAARCFNCGICTFCNKCYDYCPDVAISMDRKRNMRTIDYDYCKGCGICARECPRGAIEWVKQ